MIHILLYNNKMDITILLFHYWGGGGLGKFSLANSSNVFNSGTNSFPSKISTFQSNWLKANNNPIMTSNAIMNEIMIIRDISSIDFLASITKMMKPIKHISNLSCSRKEISIHLFWNIICFHLLSPHYNNNYHQNNINNKNDNHTFGESGNNVIGRDVIAATTVFPKNWSLFEKIFSTTFPKSATDASANLESINNVIIRN